MVSARDLEKSFGAHTVFRGCSFALAWGDRAGLVGPDGVGKSTLLRILDGSVRPDRGTAAVARGARVGHLEQDPRLPEGRGVREAALEATGELRDLQERLAAAEADLAAGQSSEEAVRRYGDLQARFEQAGGWAREHEAEAALAGLGLSAATWDLPVEALSGGQRVRLALCRLLLSSPDLLLLDEPTNHLDVEAVEWLEARLQRFEGALLCVSHDRVFLDRVCTRILELSPDGAASYPGGYTAYVRQREARAEALGAAAARAAEEEERLRAYVERYRAGNRSRQAKSRQHRLEALRRRAPEAPRPAAEGPALRLEVRGASGREVLAVERLAKAYGDRVLFRPWDAVVRRGERIGVVGPNGAGKTTLLRVLAGEEEADAGAVLWGRGVELSWLRQDERGLDDEETVLGHVLGADERMGAPEARSLLARFLFRGDAVFRRAGDLSGGERHRLLLCLLCLEQGNVLFCDEPTNHLDIPAREALEEALAAFPGTLFLVSHDRYLLQRLCSRIWWLDGGTVRDLPDGYAAYEDARHLAPAPAARPRPAPAAPPRPAPGRRRALQEMAALEERIAAEEARLRGLEERLGDAGLYADGSRAAATVRAYEEARVGLEALYAEWERLGEAATQDSPPPART